MWTLYNHDNEYEAVSIGKQFNFKKPIWLRKIINAKIVSEIEFDGQNFKHMFRTHIYSYYQYYYISIYKE